MRWYVVLFAAAVGAEPACPPGQRYDVATFPPRCIACPDITTNRVPLAQIAAQVRGRAAKFSPGLPQNDTCGCWRTNQTLDIELNASWVVSGLVLGAGRDRWLRDIAIEASDDNTTFLAWGRYAFRNFTQASAAIFAYPIRARYFRLTVMRYANHHVNVSGFPLNVAALVSQAQPFGCRCPLLSSGACCPFANMTVRNDTCVWCMDPQLITTVVVDGCGRCRPGTFEDGDQCIMRRRPNPVNSFTVGAPRWDGLNWTARINATTDGQSQMQLFLGPHTPISQYLQFDRGRLLSLPKALIASQCQGAQPCTAAIVASFRGLGPPQIIAQPVVFDLSVPAWAFTVAAQGPATLVELHSMGAWWALRLGTPLRGRLVYVAWNGGPEAAYNNTGALVAIDPPPAERRSLRVHDNVTRLAAFAPFTTVAHGPQTNAQLGGIMVKILYGLGLRDRPAPGDSEQIVTITAWSPQPIRLKRLATTLGGLSVLYTTSKGFIIDASRVVDLALACTQNTPLTPWLAQAIALLEPAPLKAFADGACAQIASGAVSKMYWLKPTIGAVGRTEAFGMQVLAEFA